MQENSLDLILCKEEEGEQVERKGDEDWNTSNWETENKKPRKTDNNEKQSKKKKMSKEKEGYKVTIFLFKKLHKTALIKA